VLIKVKNEFLELTLKHEDFNLRDSEDKMKNFPFMLQVWSNKGKMVFEQRLSRKPIAWNMHRTEKNGDCEFVL